VTGVLLLFTLAAMANAAFARIRPSSVDKAVLNNARQLAAAANQYCLEHKVTSCAHSDLVGPNKLLKVIGRVQQETYPGVFQVGGIITITGVAGARTITYAP
jgi:type IV pilus assembly protein PilA